MQVETEFEEEWANGMVQGWESVGQENGYDSNQHTVIDVDLGIFFLPFSDYQIMHFRFVVCWCRNYVIITCGT